MDEEEVDFTPPPVRPGSKRRRELHAFTAVGLTGPAGTLTHPRHLPTVDKATFERWEQTFWRYLASPDGLNLDAEHTRLVACGGAWADHVAVTSFLAGKAAELHLYLPAALVVDRRTGQPTFTDTLEAGWQLQLEHRVFDDALGQPPGTSVAQLAEAIKQGATVYFCEHDGFGKALTEAAGALQGGVLAVLAPKLGRDYPTRQSSRAWPLYQMAKERAGRVDVLGSDSVFAPQN